MNAFRAGTTSAERQLAGYQFILGLFQLPTPCYHLDCRHIILTQGDPQRQEDLHDFLQWIGAYWLVHVITLHPEDGVVPASVQKVLQEHQFLHQALNTKLQLDWLYFAPYVEDIIQQAYLTSFWLLDRVGMLMTGKTTFISQVRDWPFDETIFLKIQSWPEILNRYKNIRKTPESVEKNTEILLQETEESATWRHFERELYTAFSTLQISVQEKMRGILYALQHPSPTQKDTPLRLSLKDYVALYQTYEKEHQSLLRLSPSSLADYHPEQEKKTAFVASKTSFTLPFFSTKQETSLTFPYESLPAIYREASMLTLPSDTGSQSPFNVFIPALMAHWESLSDIPQKAALSPAEQQFILHSLLHPSKGKLSMESLSLSREGQANGWFFIEQLLTYNPHIAEIAVPSDWEIPQHIDTLLHKNQQGKASLYYASLPKIDYEALGWASSLSDAQTHRKKLAVSYASKALPWIKNTLKDLKSTLSPHDYASLKSEIQDNYLPTIKALSTHKRTPPIQASMEYEQVFQGCKPIPEESTLSPEVLATVFSFH